jgi:hypothetical protein
MPPRDKFTVENIKKCGVLFAPYDKELAIVQNELHLTWVDAPK